MRPVAHCMLDNLRARLKLKSVKGDIRRDLGHVCEGHALEILSEFRRTALIRHPPMGQCRLNTSLRSRPETIFANDNLVDGAIVATLLLATTIAGANGGCLDAI
jgi:hypothetical protein